MTLRSMVAALLAFVCAHAPTLGQDSLMPESQGLSSDGREISSTISGKRIAGRVRFLASRFMEGREAGTSGERLAAEYLQAFYFGLGLSPAGDEGSFFQRFEFDRVSLAERNTLAVIHETADSTTRSVGTLSRLRNDYEIGDGWLPFNISSSSKVEGPVVFAGYGITAPEYEYDDYGRHSVRGKIVLLLRGEPREQDPESVFKGLRYTKHSAFVTKARLAQQHGAIGVLFVTSPLYGKPSQQRPGNSLARWSSLTKRGDFDRRGPADPQELYPEIAKDIRIPIAHIAPEIAADLLGRPDRLAEVQKKIDASMKALTFDIEGARIEMELDIKRERIPVLNVVAKLEGSDPTLAKEHIIIGGHYDHVGYGRFGSATRAWDKLHPGADDNASGTAVIMSIAEAMALAETKPKRSILFLHVTAEEKGLWGSRWFVEHPSVPLEDTVAMLNLDMVGRNDPSVVSVNGDERAKGLDALIKRIGKDVLQIEVNNDAGSGIDRSDQWAFALKNIPSVAFFSGTHTDYHSPSDVASRIVEQKMQNIARLATMVAWEISVHGGETIAAPLSGRQAVTTGDTKP